MRIVFRLERDDGTLLLPEHTARVLPCLLPIYYRWRAQHGSELVCERTQNALEGLRLVVETKWVK